MIHTSYIYVLLCIFSLCVRLDTTLIDFSDMKCQRGDLSFIFNGDAPPAEAFVVLDNEQKVYQRIHHEVSDHRLCALLCSIPSRLHTAGT